MRLVAIDPGVNTGIAVFQNTILWQCAVLHIGTMREGTKFLFQLADDAQPDHAYVELPRVYPQSKWKGDPNDLIKVAVFAGLAVAALSPFCDVQLISPQEWKGNRPKKVDNAKTRELLNPIEKQVLLQSKIPPAVAHNVLDAIGIGLWALKRK